jgi:hypothetical protein
MMALSVTCNCGQTILLPVSKPPEIALRQLALASADPPRNVLCPHCKRVSAYLLENFRRVSVQNMAQRQLLEDQVSVCIVLPCGEAGCASLVKMHTPMRLSATLRVDAIPIAAQLEAVGAVCDRGHLNSGLARRSSLEVFLNPGWEPRPE